MKYITTESGLIIPEDTIDVVLPDETGLNPASEHEDQSDEYARSGIFQEFPSSWIIPLAKLKEMVREAREAKTMADFWCMRMTNQSPTHECVTHATMQAFEACLNRSYGMNGRAPYVSPLSIYLICNPGVRGGTTLSRALNVAHERGFLPDRHGPAGPLTQVGKYPVTLHTTAGRDSVDGGPWVKDSALPANQNDVRAGFRVLTAFNVRTLEQFWSGVARGVVIVYARSGHCIPGTLIDFRGDELIFGYRDSYRIIRWDSASTVRRALGSAFGIAATTKPPKPLGGAK